MSLVGLSTLCYLQQNKFPTFIWKYKNKSYLIFQRIYTYLSTLLYFRNDTQKYGTCRSRMVPSV